MGVRSSGGPEGAISSWHLCFQVSHEEYAVACLATGSAVEECEVYWDAAMAGSFPLKQPSAAEGVMELRC